MGAERLIKLKLPCSALQKPRMEHGKNVLKRIAAGTLSGAGGKTLKSHPLLSPSEARAANSIQDQVNVMQSDPVNMPVPDDDDMEAEDLDYGDLLSDGDLAPNGRGSSHGELSESD